MGIYSKFIYPTLMDKTLNKPSIADLRKRILSNVKGEILEIGFGTGLNLEYYPNQIEKITAIDNNDALSRKAKMRIEESLIEVEFKKMSAEVLPFNSNTFDSVVSTFTFCSIEDIEKALCEIYRVLKPQGCLFFLEHGLSPDRNLRRLQNFINPAFKVISCNLNRDMVSIIETQKFEIINLEQFYQDDMAKLYSWLYMGIAKKV